jgi:putative addiction module component (TIGR02574 family)
MPQTLQELGLDRWSPEDRLRLIGELWDSLDPIEQTELSDVDRKELDRRLAAADAHPEAGRPWEEVRARLWEGR